MIGQIVNYRYEVLEKVGDGDIFSVYKSRDKVLNRLVALKVLSKDLADNPTFTTAVRAGYGAVAALDHPNIARVLEADSTSNEPFIVCEYVRGINVKDRVKRAGPVQVPLALDIVIPVLEALEYAHANRIVHGDLRPQDIIVSPDGEVKVTDFGLASALRQYPDITNRMPMRSVYYEAPEIAEGAEPSVSSDIYSTGAILYEMLTGQVPFEGSTAIAVALKQSKELPTPPRMLNTGIQKSLSDLVMRALDKDPSDRFSNVTEMLTDLRAIRDGLRMGKPLSIPQPSVSAKQTDSDDYSDSVSDGISRKSYIWLVAIFVAVVLGMGFVTYLMKSGENKIIVPALLGMTRDEAMVEAKKAGIRLIDDGEIYSDEYEDGQIASVVPPASSKVPSSNPIVRVKYSKGPATKDVPDLSGLPESEAYQAARDEGFSVGKVTTEYSDRIPINSVVKQDPEKDTQAKPGSKINLVISLGPKPEPVDTSGDEGDDTATANERRFNVAVEVPEDSQGQQEVRIVVDDDHGESTAVQEFHNPGDKFTAPVTAYGSTVRIKVYVGGHLESDDTY